LRVYVLEQGGTWDSHLPLIDFTYNNSYHSSIGMAPLEALYGRRCRTPLCWFESDESVVLGPDIVQQTTEKVKLIQEKMKASQSRQKSYHDKRRKDLEFQEGDHAFLRVTLDRCWTCIEVKETDSEVYRSILDIRKNWNSGVSSGFTTASFEFA